MPVFTCSGPQCERLISVSSVPGGNPAALAEPEGFAVEYLQCRSCKKYFCDRSLVKLGINMQASKCPSCQGPLFNPTAVLMSATPQPATPQITRVTFSGKSLLWPNLCACCGGPSDATFDLSDSYVSSRHSNGAKKTTTTITQKVSSCKACSPHINMAFSKAEFKASALVDVDQIKVDKNIFSTMVVVLGLGFIGWVMVAEGPLRQEVPRESRDLIAAVAAVVASGLGLLLMLSIRKLKLNTRKRAALESNDRARKADESFKNKIATIGSNCCRTRMGQCVNFIAEKNQLIFYRKDFAEAFVQLNKANISEVTRSTKE